MGQNMNIILNPQTQRASYVMSFGVILEKIDRVITVPHCITFTQSEGSPIHHMYDIE